MLLKKSQNQVIPSWIEIKVLMRKLQTLKQGSKSVNNYYEEMMLFLEEVNIFKDEEATMDRF